MSEAKEQQASEMVERVMVAIEIVERVAKAIASDPIEIEKDGRPLLRIDWENSTELYRFMARKAIAAMRDPTEVMTEAGANAAASARPEGVPLIWRAMIDEALK